MDDRERMVQLAVDLAEFTGVTTGEALTALRSALTGDAEPLRVIHPLPAHLADHDFTVDEAMAELRNIGHGETDPRRRRGTT